MGACFQHDIIVGVDFGHLAEVGLLRCSTGKFFFPPFYIVHFGRKKLCADHT
jgi:hypothetical protein